MSNLDFKIKQPVKNDDQPRIEPHLSLSYYNALNDQASAPKSIDDEQFTEALERCFRKSVYNEYNYLPRWAVWS